MPRQFLLFVVFIIALSGCKMGSSTADSGQKVAENAVDPNTSSEAQAAGASQVKFVPTPTPAPANAVCSDPSKPCQHKEKHFDDWELSFKLPAKLQPNKTNKSAPFFGIILKTFEMEEDCDGGEYVEAIEAARKQLQQEQPGRKVFASYGCPNMSAVDYDFAGKYDAKKETVVVDNFIAIYAGQSKEEAEQTLAKLKAKYPRATLKQMTATYQWIVQ